MPRSLFESPRSRPPQVADSMSVVHAQVIKTKPRIAFAMRGCIRSLSITTPGKLQNVWQAQAAGSPVDLFCLLEVCLKNEEEQPGSLKNFVDQFRAIGEDQR